MKKPLPRPLLAWLLALVALATAGLGSAHAVSGDRQTKVVGGTVAAADQWPFLVALVTPGTRSPMDRQFCGGSVIAPQWVLTAAHCVVDSANRPIQPQQVAVLAGTLTLAAGRGQEIPVDAVNVADGYPNGADAALLHLAAPTASPPVALAQPDQAALWAPGTRAFLAGWGDTGEDAGAFPVDARQVSIPVISDARCRTAIGPEVVAARELCAGAPAGKVDSCQGDSGGPLAARTASVPVLIGIVSWGYGCARRNTPGMYTRVSALGPWVQAVTGAPAQQVALPAAPAIRVRPLRAVGRRGRAVELSYVLAGAAGRSSEYVAVLNAKGKILAHFETEEGPFASNQDVFYVRWKLPRSAPRTLYFCVAAAPPGTDYGEPGCARILVRSPAA